MKIKNEIQEFVNENLGLKVRCIQNEDGSISMNAEDTTVGFGLIQKQKKNGKEYTSIRWETFNNYCKEFNFPNKLGKDDFIPESLFYLLGMKASNERAKKFQMWLASDVIPTIRKHGIYAADSVIERLLKNPDTMIRVLTELKSEREQRVKLEKENASLLPDAKMARDIIKYDGLYTLKEVADLIGSGRTKLFEFLRLNKILSKQTGYNLPLRRYTKRGYFKVKISETYKIPVTLVTPKGLKFIYHMIKKHDLTNEFNAEILLKTAKSIKEIC